MVYAELLSQIFDEKTVAVLSGLLQKKDEFGIRELAREAGVSAATTYRIVQKLSAIGLVSKRKRGKSVYYNLVKNTKGFNQIYGVIIGELPKPLDVLREELMRRFGGDFKVLARGSEGNKKIFVVSDRNIAAEHNDLAREVYEKTGQKLAFVCVSQTQFEQMREVGIV